jgi:hypothetical protein
LIFSNKSDIIEEKTRKASEVSYDGRKDHARGTDASGTRAPQKETSGR